MLGYKKYIELNYNRLKQHLNSYFENKDFEELHKIRVDIKKIRALTFWRNSHDEIGVDKASKKLKKLFRESGQIRTCLIHIDILKKYNLKSKQVERVLSKKLTLYIRLFDLHYWIYKKEIDVSSRFLQNHITELPQSIVLKNIITTSKSIQKNLLDYTKDEDWHQARKQIKIILYNAELLNTKKNGEIKLNLDYLKDMQHLLGEWHDLTVTYELLNNYLKHSDKKLKKLKQQILDYEKEIVSNSEEFKSKMLFKN
jgi:CHAD domain-containing protein